MDKVIPSAQGSTNAYIVASVIRYGAGTDGWVQPADSALLADTDPDIADGPLGAFAEAGRAGLDLTLESGEGFVGGAWLARDVQTTYTAPDNATTDVYLGWDHDATDTVRIGDASAFQAPDPRLHIYTVTTDSGSITSVTDERPVGASTALGQAELGADSRIGRFIADAAAEAAAGTPGDSVNEVQRITGSASDTVVSHESGDGAYVVARNAYYDGQWRYTVGGEPAFRVVLGDSSDGVRLSVADPGVADDTLSWDGEFRLSADGSWTTAAGTTVYDATSDAVPQTVQDGPAGSLTDYPLPPGDLQTGAGSGLDADTVDGYGAGELQGGAGTVIDTYSTTDASSSFGYDSGTLDTSYDVYRVQATFYNADSNEVNSLRGRVNNDATSNYTTLFADHEQDKVNRNQGKNQWQHLGETGAEMIGQVEMLIRGSNPPGTDSGGTRRPTMTCDSMGWPEQPQAIGGQLKVDYGGVDNIIVESWREATGHLRVIGETF
jgi:hypothetical protein